MIVRSILNKNKVLGKPTSILKKENANSAFIYNKL